MLTPRQRSEQQRHSRTLGYQRMRAALGKPEPSDDERRSKRQRNENYRAKQRQKQQQEKAA